MHREWVQSKTDESEVDMEVWRAILFFTCYQFARFVLHLLSYTCPFSLCFVVFLFFFLASFCFFIRERPTSVLRTVRRTRSLRDLCVRRDTRERKREREREREREWERERERSDAVLQRDAQATLQWPAIPQHHQESHRNRTLRELRLLLEWVKPGNLTLYLPRSLSLSLSSSLSICPGEKTLLYCSGLSRVSSAAIATWRASRKQQQQTQPLQ